MLHPRDKKPNPTFTVILQGPYTFVSTKRAYSNILRALFSTFEQIRWYVSLMPPPVSISLD